MYPNGSDSTAYKNQAMSSTSFAGNKSVHHYLGRPILGSLGKDCVLLKSRFPFQLAQMCDTMRPKYTLEEH